MIRAVGVETGGSNIQFAVNPQTDEIVVIEMNPRVSRSSALASKATGFPIAKIAARLAVGYALEEIDNDITRATPASFEPTIDYVVVKWPRFAFEKFPGADGQLHTSMQSVGEAMAIGRTFKQAFVEGDALARARRARRPSRATSCWRGSRRPSHDRYELIFEAIARGSSEAEISQRTGIDPWFLAEIGALARGEDPQAGLERSFKSVDTCAAEFEAETPYYYSGWERGRPPTRCAAASRPSVVILGSRAQPHRPGHRVRLLLRARGDDRARVRPRRGDGQLQPGDRLHRLRHLRPALLRAAHARGRARRDRARAARGRDRPVRRPDAAEAGAGLADAGVPLLGTPVESIHRAEDRPSFGALLDELGLKGPPYATATLAPPRRSRWPTGWATRCWCGPRTCSAGGRWRSATRATGSPTTWSAPTADGGQRTIFLDRFLENAIEIDVDALCDGDEVRIGAIMQHVEEAGVHSGDSACVIPAMSLGPEMLRPGRATPRRRSRCGSA